MGKFFLSMGNLVEHEEISFGMGKFALANSFVHGQFPYVMIAHGLASYFSMGKFTFVWSTDTDALAHGQIHFCVQTFCCLVNNKRD